MYIMENEYYNNIEGKFFGDIYTYLKNAMQCDISGNISASDVEEFLINSFNLSEDIVNQIGIVTEADIKGWYGEKQLYFALKLVSAAQQGLPISPNTLLLHTDLPLPNFFANNNIHLEKENAEELKESHDASSPDLIQLSDSDCPGYKKENTVGSSYQIMISEDDIDEDHAGEDANSDLMGNLTSHSPSVSSTASESPTPTNSVHEKNWNKGCNSQWHNLVNDEHRQLLGTEEDSSEKFSSGEEDGEEEDVWTITEEQQQYYSEQFLTMQSDLSGLLSGFVAKEFFEKSKLPITELSKIWHLSDVTRDGALSLEEFYTAMHLVVLRRNNIPLPDALPVTLLPKLMKNQNEFTNLNERLSDEASNKDQNRISSSDYSGTEEREPEKNNVASLSSPQKGKEWAKFIDSPTNHPVSSPGSIPANFEFPKTAPEKTQNEFGDGTEKKNEYTKEQIHVSSSEYSGPEEKEQDKNSDLLSSQKGKEWAKFVDSPTNHALSSPGPKPVNFDFHKAALEKDPMILHPKPLRVTPEAKRFEKTESDCVLSSQDAEPETLQRPSHILRPPVCATPPRLTEASDILHKPPAILTRSMSPSSIQASLRLQEDSCCQGGPPSLPLISHPPKKDMPPPPPPRPTKAHVRSSSLDLNKICKNIQPGGPPVPLRSSPLTNSPLRHPLPSTEGDISSSSRENRHLSDVSEDTPTSVPNPLRNSNTDQDHLSAFEVYKKPQDETENLKTTSSEEDEKQQSLLQRLRDKRDLISSLHTFREKNAVLSRVNSELNQELAEVIEERIALEFQLEQMKPFSN